MYRSNCFWYTPWKDMSATFDQCYLAETGECPCSYDCDWFIDSVGARALVFEKLMKDKEKRDAHLKEE